MASSNLIPLILILSISHLVIGEGFDKDFKTFIVKNYGVRVLDGFARADILNTGSFGGGLTNKTERAVVLVHGLNNQAGNFWKIRRDFVAAGFPKARIFATTYGQGENSDIGFDETMKCEHVQHIRSFIQVVAAYTGRKVDVIGYSMGSPISRKAILGGHCVDTNDDLGPPISKLIHTFISVAGANQGSDLCSFPFFAVCNTVNGLSCESSFLNDINSKERYEGVVSYNLASKRDSIVGYMVCEKKASHFVGAEEIVFDKLYHEQLEFDTAAAQLKILWKHKEDSDVNCTKSNLFSVVLLVIAVLVLYN